MPYAKAHGGECCGMKHVYGMGEITTRQDLDNIVDRAQRNWAGDFHGEPDRNLCVEITCNDNQLRRDDYALCKLLRAKGFIRKTRFFNGNSGNVVHVFHYVPDRNLNMDRPDPWIESRPRRGARAAR